MNTPRTPQECQLPPPSPSGLTKRARGGPGCFRPKVGRRAPENRWILPCTRPKSLIVYNYGPTSCMRFSTGCDSVSTDSPVFSTCRFFAVFASLLSISLFLKKKKREKKHGEKNRQSTGFSSCLFFNPRVFTPIHPFSVDTCGSVFHCKSWR